MQKKISKSQKEKEKGTRKKYKINWKIRSKMTVNTSLS